MPEILAILALIVLVWVNIGVLLTRERQHAVDDAMTDTAALAKAFEEGTKRIITEIDQTLLSARVSYQLEGDNFDIQKWAKSMVRSDDLRVQIALMDRDGNQVKSTLARSNLRRVNIADRPHFQAQLDPSHDDLYISNPVVGRGSGVQTIQFTRKMLDSNGAFDGVAVLSLGCAQISEFYETSEDWRRVCVTADDPGRGAGPWAEPARHDWPKHRGRTRFSIHANARQRLNMVGQLINKFKAHHHCTVMSEDILS